MYQVTDIVVYGTEGICEIQGTTEKKFDGRTIEYYVLRPLAKQTETVYVPMNNEKVLSKMRHILTREEADSLLNAMPIEPANWIENDKERQKSYKDILLYGNSKDILAMTRALYFHRLKKMEVGKKLHAADERFMKDAEKMLFQELAYVYSIEPEEVLTLIAQSVQRSQTQEG